MTYVHPTRPHGAVKSVLPPHAVTGPHDPPDPPERARAAWVVRVPLDALDHRKNGGLGHRWLGLILVLEGYCRTKAYCWPGDDELAAAFGCRRSSLQELLGELEDAGWIRRVRTPKGRPGRVGILLLRRLDPDLPTADPADIVALLGRATHGRDRAREAGPAVAEKPAAERARKTGRRIRTVDLKEYEETLTFARAGDPDPEPEAVPAPIEPPQAKPTPGPLEPATTPEALGVNPAPAEVTTAILAVQAPSLEAEPDPVPTPEQVAAELAELEATIAARGSRPPSAMERIRLKNLRDLRDGTWKADPLACPAPVPARAPAETPRLGSWPSALGPVETSDLIRRLASPGAGPEAIEEAACRVADRLGDRHSLGFYRRAFARVRSGGLPISLALSAWKLARSESARSPGAVFVSVMEGDVRR